MMRHRKSLAVAVAIGLLSAPAAWAENFAILVAVSTYRTLDERLWLKGPANDVALVRDYLTTSAPLPFETGNIAVLADGVSGATDPTLAAIRQAFADMAERVGEDDFVYLHFSGHGSQALP